MQTRGRRVNRWLAVVAATLIALGSMLVVVGSASASTPIGHFPTIRFWNTYNVVTMDVPARAWCPKSEPFCEWQLFVDEPDIPSQTVVGTATGTSGILTVNYPKDFCGVIQADAIVGPSPWLFQYGRKHAIKTGTMCGGHPTTTTTRPPPTTTTRPWQTTTTTCSCNTTTTKPWHNTTTTIRRHRHRHKHKHHSLPYTSTTKAAAVAATAKPADPSGKDPAAQLPFTGADIRPLIFIGSALIVIGGYILTTLEQRRRAMRRMAYSMRSSSAAGFASRTSRWFLGD